MYTKEERDKGREKKTVRITRIHESHIARTTSGKAAGIWSAGECIYFGERATILVSKQAKVNLLSPAFVIIN